MRWGAAIQLKGQTRAWVLALGAAMLLAAGQSNAPHEAGVAASGPEASDRAELRSLRARHAALQRQLAQYAPSAAYIVVDTARNRLSIKRKETVLLTSLASTGSGMVLDHPERPGSHWVFDTPRGEFAVQSKLLNPVWVKPDWAFLEEGLDLPTNPEQRLEPGILGEYALGFGKGYFIHGTLYTRLLGRNVTHGCVRLNDEDLRTTYQLARIGTPIMIF